MTPGWSGIALMAIALVLFWGSARAIARGRVATGVISGIAAVAPAALGGVCLGLSATFTAIDRLAAEEPVGTIGLSATGTGAFIARLRVGNSDPLHYRLAGDHWQLDVRFLKWKLPAILLGADSMYQLDRLSGRYAEPADSAEIEVTAYGLSGSPGRTLWQLASTASRRFGWVDTISGNAVYMPMADGASYRISVTRSGLGARPDNAAARQAVTDW